MVNGGAMTPKPYLGGCSGGKSYPTPRVHKEMGVLLCGVLEETSPEKRNVGFLNPFLLSFGTLFFLKVVLWCMVAFPMVL